MVNTVNKIRPLGQILLLVLVFVLWASGVASLLEASALRMNFLFLGAGLILFSLHYFRGKTWLVSSLEARMVEDEILTKLTEKYELEEKPELYVTRPLEGANAFTVSYSSAPAIFVTPEIWRSSNEILAPVIAHELAHLKNGDSLVNGFVTAFEKLIHGFGQVWMFLLFSGPLGWLALLFFWPLILVVQLWSHLTLIIYRPLATAMTRASELDADRLAARWTSPELVAESLKSIENYNRRWYSGLFRTDEPLISTHPSLDKRLINLEENT